MTFKLGGSRRINLDLTELTEESGVSEIPTPTPAQTPREIPEERPPVNQPRRIRNRTGNGHRKQAVRKFLDCERDYMRSVFQEKNGQLEHGDCAIIKRDLLDGNEIAIWQVVGFISYLHRSVASGVTLLRDPPSYLTWMQNKYPALFAQFNSEKYRQLRRYNETQGADPVPDILLREPASPEPFYSTTPTLSAVSRQAISLRTGT